MNLTLTLCRLILTLIVWPNSPWLAEAVIAADQQAADRHTRLEETARPLLKHGHEDRTLEWLPLAIEHFDTDRDVLRALCVISFESGGKPNAANPTSSASGLWQHLGKYWQTRSRKAGVPGASIWEPEAQFVVAAWLVYSTPGSWRHWTVYRGNCR